MIIHIVKSGESLWSISRMHAVNPNVLQRTNGLLDNQMLVIGQALIIPATPEKRFGYLDVNGFILPSEPVREKRILDSSARYLTYLSPFSYQVQNNGSIAPIADETIIATGLEYGAAPMLSVTNIAGSNFDTPLVHRILTSPSLQQTVINNISKIVRDKNYYGVIVDFERIPPDDKEAFAQFLRNLTNVMHPNHIVGIALAPKTAQTLPSAWHGAHDYKLHGNIVDFSIIMTYEWGWSGGPPMAVAPINEVEKVIRYAVSQMPAKKILMGMPLYGYDWTLPFVPGGAFAESIGNEEAVRRASRTNSRIEFDRKAQTPHYEYYDRNKKRHEVWFEDARSVRAKYLLASEYGLRGVSFWSLAQPFTQNFVVLNDMFRIVKVI